MIRHCDGNTRPLWVVECVLCPVPAWSSWYQPSRRSLWERWLQPWKTPVSEFLKFVFAYLLVQVLERVVQYSIILDWAPWRIYLVLGIYVLLHQYFSQLVLTSLGCEKSHNLLCKIFWQFICARLLGPASALVSLTSSWANLSLSRRSKMH